MHDFERHVLRACAATGFTPACEGGRTPLIGAADRVVVAASGGADSTALVVALAALRAAGGVADLVLAHLDHGLRDADAAARDRAAVVALAARLSLPVVCGQADTRAEALARGTGSLEAAARAVRYRFLAEVARERGATRVAVGHTADDQVETILLRATRGTGLRGLGGMSRRRLLDREDPASPLLVRPLLRLKRDAGRAYLADIGVSWVEDASNDDRRFRRNQVRHDLLPALRAAGPDVEAALLRLARQARAAASAIEVEAGALLVLAERGHAWDVAILATAAPAVRDEALRALIALGAPARVDARAVRALRAIVRAGEGAVDLAGGLRARVEAGRLAIAPIASPAAAEPEVAAIPLAREGATMDPAAELVFEARLRPAVQGEPSFASQADPARLALLDAARAQGALAVRRRREGDRFWPLGAPGGRTLKKFLIDRKVPRDERARTPVVTLDDRPVWVVGHRIDERFKVTSETNAVLELRAVPSGGQQKGS